MKPLHTQQQYSAQENKMKKTQQISNTPHKHNTLTQKHNTQHTTKQNTTQNAKKMHNTMHNKTQHKKHKNTTTTKTQQSTNTMCNKAQKSIKQWRMSQI